VSVVKQVIYFGTEGVDFTGNFVVLHANQNLLMDYTSKTNQSRYDLNLNMFTSKKQKH
jgi:hypothetical protein